MGTTTKDSPSTLERIPTKDEMTQVGPDKDANDKVAIVVHGEQHDKVGDGELKHVDK